MSSHCALADFKGSIPQSSYLCNFLNMILTPILQMNHVPYKLTPGHLSKSDKNITTQTIGKSLRYIRSAVHFFHFRSSRSFNNNHANILVYFRRILNSGLFIGMNLLREVTAIHLFNSLG